MQWELLVMALVQGSGSSSRGHMVHFWEALYASDA